MSSVASGEVGEEGYEGWEGGEQQQDSNEGRRRGMSVTIDELELVRDLRWMMGERRTYGRFRLEERTLTIKSEAPAEARLRPSLKGARVLPSR